MRYPEVEEACACYLSMQLSYRMDAEIPISNSRRRYRENGGAQDQDSL